MTDPRDTIIAASPFCFGGVNPFVAYRHLARAGIRYVEIPALPTSTANRYDLTTLVPETMDEAAVRELKERLTSMGLTPLTVAAFCELLDPRQAELLRRRIDFARQLGAGYLITDATSENDLPPDRLRKVINALRYFGDYAADCGVRIALETHEGPTRNGRLARDFLEAVDHPNVGLNYDTGNIYYYNEGIDPADDIRHVAERVIHVHLKDTSGGKGEWRFCALGDGRVRFPEVIQVLQAAGFRGPYSLEVEGEQGEDLNCEAHLRRVEKSLSYLGQIGLRS
jgi:inosose dehydratase